MDYRDATVVAVVKIFFSNSESMLSLSVTPQSTVNDLKMLICKSNHSRVEYDQLIMLQGGQILDNEISVEFLCKRTPGTALFLQAIAGGPAYLENVPSMSPNQQKSRGYVMDDVSLLAAKNWVQRSHGFESDSRSFAVKEVIQASIKEDGNDTPVSPAPPVALPIAPPAPAPRWFDMRVISRIAFSLFLFGRDLPAPLLVLLFIAYVVYYLYETGVGAYLMHVYMPGPVTRPSQASAAAHRDFSLQGLVAQGWLRVPAASGLLLDGLSLLLSICLSLLPGWSPDGALQL